MKDLKITTLPASEDGISIRRPHGPCGHIQEPSFVTLPDGRLFCSMRTNLGKVFFATSADNGLTWTNRENIYPEDGMAVYCTEVSVIGEEITAYLSIHLGRFLDWKCVMMKSFDNGYTWENAGEPPFFPEYTFIRGTIHTKDGIRLIPYALWDNRDSGAMAVWLRET